MIIETHRYMRPGKNEESGSQRAEYGRADKPTEVAHLNDQANASSGGRLGQNSLVALRPACTTSAPLTPR